MRTTLRIVLMVLATFAPYTLPGQERAQPDTFSVRGYAVGSYKPLGVDTTVQSVGADRLKNSRLVFVGLVDDVNFPAHCKKGEGEAECNRRAKEVLGRVRGNEFYEALSTAVGGISRANADFQTQVSKEVDPQKRGVYLFVNGRLVTPDSRPEDFATTRDTALVRQVNENTSQIAANARGDSARDSRIADHGKRIAATERTNAQQGDSLRNLAVEVNNLKNRSRNGAGDREVSFRFIGGQMTSANGLNIATTNFSMRNKPRGLGAGASLEGGLWPLGSDETCSRAAVQLGAMFDFWVNNWFGTSLGVSTARNMCVNGGPGVAFTAQDEINAVSYGPTVSKKAGRIELYVHVGLVWAFTHKNGEADIDKNVFGSRVTLGAQTSWR